jgi:GNAT superfamily N-acetyltransferase
VTPYLILPFDPETTSGPELEKSGRLQQVLAHERVLEDPLTPVAAFIRRMAATTPHEWRAIFAARDTGGALVAMGFVGRHLNEPENAHIRWCEIGVHPEHRRRGIGRALVGAIVAACDGQGEDVTFMGQTSDRVPPGEAFCSALGADAGLAMKTNQLDLASLDTQVVSEWAARAATGYRLELIVNTVPDALMPAFLEASNGMNDAPKGTMRFADERVTAEQMRDREAWCRTVGIERRAIVAVHEPTGEGGGFTGLSYDPQVPHVIQQGGTAVIGGHRGHGIGLWMKATMLQHVLAEWPAARYIRTGNAHTNEQMLAINIQLGFRHAWSTMMWQLPLAAARASVAGAGAAGKAAAGADGRRP